MKLLTAAKRITRALFGLKDSGRRASARVASVVLLTGLLSSAIPAAELTINQGVVVKFGAGAGLIVRDKATIQPSTVFTSQADDSAGGQSNPTVGVPTQASWRGIRLEKSASAFGFTLTDSAIRYAGSASDAAAAALSVRGFTPTLRNLLVSDSALGLRLSEVGSPIVRDSSFLRNTTGVEVSGNSTPTFATSEFVGNTSFAISNLTPASVVQATGNWWGAASGPKDTVGSPGNPNGQGDRVSLGVNYGAFTLAEPPIGCSIKPASGVFTTAVRAIDFTLACRNAIEVRLAETVSGLAGVAFTAITNTVTFTLSSAVGSKTVYAEFRGAGGVSALTTVVTTDQPIVYSPNAPQVTITAPLAGATVTADTVISATAVDSIAISSVQFLISGQSIGLVSQSPYSANWNVAGFANGSYQIEVRATNALGAVGSSTIAVTLAKPQTDFSGPAISAIKWNNATLNAGDVLSAPGTLSFQLNDATSLGSATATLGVNVLSTWVLSGTQQVMSIPVTFQDIANGSYILRIDARDSFGNASTNSTNVVVTLPAPSPAPTITRPTNNQTVSQSSVPVGGTAPIGTLVQLYLNSIANGGLLQVDGSGNWASSVALPAEGSFALTADARNVRGITAKSATISVNYVTPGPSVNIVSPANGVTLSDPLVVEASVSSTSSTISQVSFTVNGVPTSTVTVAPYRFTLDVTTLSNGAATIVATAMDARGRSGSDSRLVTIAKRPPPVITPYTGEISSVTPTTSFGQTSVVVTGRSKNRSTAAAAVPNATLRLILSVAGFERKISLVTDSAGNFVYNFVPQNSDAGSYGVVAVHPDEYPVPASANSFVINRLSVSPTTYTLNAAKGFSETVRVYVTASAGQGARGVTISAPSGVQAGGALGVGIAVATSAPVDIAAGQTVPVDLIFTSSANSLDTGIVILQMFSPDSGTAVRGDVRIDYRLYAAQPALSAIPSYLELGLRQSQVVSGVTKLQNKGLVAAQGVSLSLINMDGTPAPNWLTLVSAPLLGTVAPADTPSIQINAAPTASVADGIYQFKLRVTSSNATGGDVPISVAVTQAGDGTAQFHVIDMFTNTTDKDGVRIAGLKGSTVVIENENVSTFKRTFTTLADGIAAFTSIPAGSYRYRISAPDHTDTGGRIRVNPGAATVQRVLLEYTTISVSFAVTETTIKDVYDVTLSATYRTQVPAPVVLIEPMYINIPPMQVGEEITGEVSISNYGLVRADEVNWKPPVGDSKIKIEFFGEVPTQLAAKQRIVLPYKITQLSALAVSFSSFRIADTQSALKRLSSVSEAQKAGACYTASYVGDVTCAYVCAEGVRSTSCGGNLTLGQTIGAACGAGGTGSGGGGGGGGGGFGGGGGSPSGTSLGGVPCKGCTTCGPCN